MAAVIGGRPGEASFADYIRTQAKNPYVRGVRQVLHGATPRGYCLQDTFVQSMRLLGELGLLFDICVRPDELPDAVTLVRQCPDTRFVRGPLRQCGSQSVAARRAPRGRRAFARSGRLATRHGRAGEATQRHLQDQRRRGQGAQPQWTAEDLAPVVNHCLDAFGPERVVFGSDWPVCRMGGELGRLGRRAATDRRARPECSSDSCCTTTRSGSTASERVGWRR